MDGQGFDFWNPLDISYNIYVLLFVFEMSKLVTMALWINVILYWYQLFFQLLPIKPDIFLIKIMRQNNFLLKIVLQEII